jgi:hypothetical protein
LFFIYDEFRNFSSFVECPFRFISLYPFPDSNMTSSFYGS